MLPGTTDGAVSIDAVAAAARAHGATTFGASALRLAPLVKDHDLGFVGKRFPGLLPSYERSYPGSTAPAGYRRSVEVRIAAARERHGFGRDSMRARSQPAAQAAPGAGRDGHVQTTLLLVPVEGRSEQARRPSL